MVVAATVRALVRGECCYCSKKFRIVSCNPFYQPINKEERQAERRREWNVWLASTADDLDLLGDWLFFWHIFNGDRGGFEDNLTYVLFVFCCLGSLTWLLEAIHITFVNSDQGWTWLSFLILAAEDIPQLVITLMIQGSFANITNYGLFNLMTSLYSVMVRLAGELFMNCCYCCERVPKIEADVENAKSYKPSPY